MRPWTLEEKKAWDAVAEAAERVMALSEDHPMERGELASAFHVIQRAILARPMRRWLRESEEERNR